MDKQIVNATDFLGKTVTIKVDRQLHSRHPRYDWVYELNYGFVPETISSDGEEMDAYIIGIDIPIEEFRGTCVAVIHRIDDNDDKLVVVTDDKKSISDDEIRSATNFKEQFFRSEIIRNLK